MTVRTVLSTLSIFSALLGACSDTHSPQAGDTNTSWLHRCESQSECGRGARCIAQLCTLPCDGTSPNSCEQMSKAATCDLSTQACDVSCNADPNCRALGADFRCEAGRCRPLPELSLSEETLIVSSAENLGVSEPYVFGTQTIWLKDHFRIGTSLGESTAIPQGRQSWPSTFMVSDVFPDGRIERHLLRNDSRLGSAEYMLGENGGVARVESENDPATIDERNPRGSFPATRCTLAFYDPDLALVSTGTHPCDQSLRPITSDANGDWLTWASSEGGRSSNLGRYRPSERRWVEEPRRLALDEGFVVVSTQVRDDQFWLHAQSESGSAMLANVPFTGSLGALSVPATWQPLPVDVISPRPPGQQAGRPPLRYRDGWLMPDDRMILVQQTELAVRVQPIDPGQSQEPVSFTLEAEGKVGFGSLQRIPGRDLVAICYLAVRGEGVHNELKLRLFDTRGAALGGPLQLASPDDRTVSQCTLTWSGSDLLATWVEGGLVDGGATYSRRVRLH